jgi:hypothetical protein
MSRGRGDLVSALPDSDRKVIVRAHAIVAAL